MVKAIKEQRIIPTYIPRKATDLPMFFENKPYQAHPAGSIPCPTPTASAMTKAM